ncbi:glycosyltransferase family 2 protein [Mucilaginibacter dorajii]|uniref:Glycosyltransferase 2-like domain-containing protein n=1 Tax=Mucilaginibacter dorajii TaxID=692994 RepID=A0ABP7Q2W2_9SPHI|nr:glycosyltransferase family 2 protein [Mucilaginibacter dorajii]MCS3732774.1 glycosyltransferase involved in cell wall biosynthesis [Mucilaginibacter dorajii]
MENDQPLISICMPAYNAGAYILQSIRSIQQQSYQNWELIVVNDGSRDYTAQELQTISDPRVQVFHQQNQGQCAAANKAFSMSKGTLIKFMDADDLLSDDFLKSQVEVMDNFTDTIGYAQWGRFYKNDLNTFKLSTGPVTGNMRPSDWLISSMQSAEVMLQCALWLIPRTIINKAGLWNEELSLINDFEFFIRVLLQAKELRYADKAILYYRSGLQNSLSSTTTLKGAKSAYLSTELGTGHLLNFSDRQEVRQLSANCFQRFVYTFYPDYPELVKKAEHKVAELGGSTIPFPAGGYTRVLANLLGWQVTKKIKKLLKRK